MEASYQTTDAAAAIEQGKQRFFLVKKLVLALACYSYIPEDIRANPLKEIQNCTTDDELKGFFETFGNYFNVSDFEHLTRTIELDYAINFDEYCLVLANAIMLGKIKGDIRDFFYSPDLVCVLCCIERPTLPKK
jgi:hypothetical protein